MNSPDDIDLKITKVLAGTASDAERKEVQAWVRTSASHKFQYEQLRRFWNQPSSDLKLPKHEEQKKKIWSRYLAENNESENIPTRFPSRPGWLKVAAIILILSIPAYFIMNRTEDIVVETKPAPELISKQNPLGQKSQIQLPDGSKVWLNADSKIAYQETFADSVRAVTLEGEAFFEVVHDRGRPFTVTSGSLSVTVLGTAFNVSGFPEAKEVTVTLVDGAVQVNEVDKVEDNVVLAPGTGLVYSLEKKVYREFSKASDPGLFAKATGWRNGILVFNGVGFNEFVREITRWYGVRVKVEGTVPQHWDLMASFENELLTNIMDAVSYNKNFRYQLKDKELKIIFK